jgi:YD repeat-containing protein
VADDLRRWEEIYFRVSLAQVPGDFAGMSGSPFLFQYLSAVLRLAPAGSRTCETGIGSGYGAVWLSLRGVAAEGIDTSARLAERAQQVNNILGGQATFRTGDLFNLYQEGQPRCTAGYDPAGNRTSVIELDGTRVTFGYDALYQLIHEQRSGVNGYNTTYGYDPTSNRSLKNGALTNYTYNLANELILIQPPSGQPTTNQWDGAGNLSVENAGGQLTSYSWNPENLLIGVVYPTGLTDTFLYAADTLRQQALTASGTVNFVWDQANVLTEKDQDLAARYTDFPGVWGGLSSQRRGSVSSFYGVDQQANVRMLADSTGAVSDSYLFKAFGEELASTGSTINPLRFGGLVGYYRDIVRKSS